MSLLRFLCCGDLHLRSNTPRSRSGKFLQVQRDKLQFIIDTAEEYECDYIIFPGDVFHRWDAPHHLVKFALRMFKKFHGVYLFVFGQHDLRYHTSDKNNTPLGVLIEGLGLKALELTAEPFEPAKDLYIRGASWRDDLPKCSEKGQHIVVMHRPITTELLPWDHADLLSVQELVKLCPANLFVTGDNHKGFTYKSKGRTILNMGSVMRTTTAQIDHTPSVCIVDFDKKESVVWPSIQIPIRKNVFKKEDIEREKREGQQRSTRLQQCMQEFEKEYDPELNFVENMGIAAKRADRLVRDIIDQVMTYNDLIGE